MGIPVLGCPCAVCLSRDPKNRRLRSSGILTWEGRRFLFDAGPDYRQQGLRFQITELAGVIITHTHYDHIAGFDDLKVYYTLQKQPLACLLAYYSYEDLKHKISHWISLLDENPSKEGKFQFQIMERGSNEAWFKGLRWRTVTYEQSGMKVTGYRLENFAYLIDVVHFNEELLSFLKGIDTLILSAGKIKSSSAHPSIEETLSFASQVEAKKIWLSHISHELDHATISQLVPNNVSLAYDGLTIPC